MTSLDYHQTQHNDMPPPVYEEPTVLEPDEYDEPDDEYYDDPPEEEIIDSNSGGSGGSDFRPSWASPPSTSSPSRNGEPKVKTNFHDRGQTPAYVAPIGKIGSLSPVKSPQPPQQLSPRSGNNTPDQQNGTHSGDQNGGISSAGRPIIPHFLTARLAGKTIDEYGDVREGGVDDGDVLGQVEGDLPEMVGRQVSNDNGDVLDDDGDLLGYVVHVTTEAERRRAADDKKKRAARAARAAAAAAARPLDEFTNGGASAFRVDADGNILDGEGNVVGRLNGKEDGPKEEAERGEGGGEGGQTEEDKGHPPKENAESYRKEDESPSDIFLDVKSTTEGIQLTIRIPTVFPGGGRPPRVPKVQFS